MKNTTVRTLLIIPFLGAAAFGHANSSILKNLPANPAFDVSTVPGNGDMNPYGVAYVPAGFPKGGAIAPGDILVSNFNNSQNLQGTGTTIVSFSQTGSQKLFFQGQGLGLSTALGVLKAGYVIVGSVPTTDGTYYTITQGSLLVLDKFGRTVLAISDSALLDGPWDLTIHDQGSTAQIFISNLLSGTVTRLDVMVSPVFWIYRATQIASGYYTLPNSAALALGPTGMTYDSTSGNLYVASTGDNAIYAIPGASTRSRDAGKGRLLYEDSAHLRGPLGLVLAPNGNLIAANGDAVNANAGFPSELVEFTKEGKFVAQATVDASDEGAAFGLAIASLSTGVQLAAVDDITNTLKVWNVSKDLARP